MGTEETIIGKIIYSEEEIKSKIVSLATSLNNVYENKKVVLVIVMSGGIPFATELMKHLKFDVYMDFVRASSYQFDQKINEPKIKYDARIPLKNKEVILIDEIVDTGKTVKNVISVIKGYKPNSISLASLIVKKKREKQIIDEYFCFEYEGNDFFVGFGLDWDEKYRNLPYIASVNVKKGDN